MLDKVFYEYILAKFNANTSSVTFKGNYVYLRVNDTMTLMEATSYNAYDTAPVSYVACAEVISTETPFVESNNRSGWVKQYAFMFPLSKKDDVLAALQETRDTFLSTNTHTVTDGSDTYTFVIKCQRPTYAGATKARAGEIYVTYTMQLMADSVELGYYGNTTVVSLAINGGTLQALIVDSLTVSSANTIDPSNIITSESNISNAIIGRGVNFTLDVYYDSTTLLETLYKQIMGDTSREQIYDLRVVFDGITENYDVKVASGSVVFKKGVIVKLNITFVEA